ncbi:MAG: hypothetical protein NTZ05_10240, partial [Chloroflexi bacterium]|nr:hypothetical protein [Chloroflexota bacterium]
RTAGQLSVYVNGFLDASRSTTGGAAVNVTKTPFNIGGFYSPTNQFRPGSYFQGAVDELALYRRTLSAGELYGIWAAGERGKVEAPAGPVGLSWWPGDGNATDIMDRNLGALAGGAAFTTGKVGRAFRFNGTDAAVVVPDRGAISGLSLDSSFSVEGWVMPSTQQSGRQWVAGKAGSYGILLEDGAPRTGWSWDTPNEFAVAATTPIPVGVWTHLAAVHDRTAGELRLYVNGVLVGQAATGGASVNVNTLPFQIGGLVTPQGDLPPGQFFEGRVNELNLFDRPLSADEVNAIVAADRVGRRKPGYRAVVTAPGVPSTWQMGETKTFNVIVENSGTLPWNAAGANPVALNAFFLQSRVSLKPGDNWSQTQKIPLTADLPPGGRVTLKVSLTAPVAVCCQRVGFQVVKEGVTFMRGRTDVPITLKSAGTAIDATDAPAIWVLGRPRTFNISVTNAGKDAWAAAGAKRVIVRARFGSGAADVLLALPEGGVPAGQSRTFSVLLTPDALPGDDELTLEMVDHLGAPLPDTATRKAVTIYAAGFQAVITANTVPTRWLRGQEQTVTVTVRNAGGDVWTISGTNPMQLQAFFLNGTTTQAVGDNWTGTQTSTLPGDISPGESATLTFKMTAPTGYCCTKLGFQMVRKGIEAIPDRMEQTIILE